MPTDVAANAVETNLHYYLGTDQNFVLTDTAEADMTSWTLSFMVKKKRADADADAKLHYTTALGDGVSVSGSSATVTVVADDTDDSTMQPGTYYWELKRTDPGAEGVFGFGVFTMKLGVHRE